MLRRLASLGVSLAYAGWTGLGPRTKDECVVLYYHGVTRSQAPMFRWQMQWLKSRYCIVPLRSLLTGGWSGACVCITFDDALDNVRENAFPIIQELGVPVTIFAVAGNLGHEPGWAIPDHHPDRLERLSTEQQLREYPPELVEVGSHTMTHPDLATLEGEALLNELSSSKKALEAIVGYEVVSASAPFGSYNQETLRAAGMAGYKFFVTCDPIAFGPGDSPLCVGRFKVTPDDWAIEFRLKAKGAHRWRRTWQNLRRPGTSVSVIRPAGTLPEQVEPAR